MFFEQNNVKKFFDSFLSSYRHIVYMKSLRGYNWKFMKRLNCHQNKLTIVIGSVHGRNSDILTNSCTLKFHQLQLKFSKFTRTSGKIFHVVCKNRTKFASNSPNKSNGKLSGTTLTWGDSKHFSKASKIHFWYFFNMLSMKRALKNCRSGKQHIHIHFSLNEGP